MRIVACYLFVLIFSVFAYRKWFVSLCAALMLMAVIQHPDMPKSIGGIQGLNLWNVLMLNVFLGWWLNRTGNGRTLDCSFRIKLAFVLFLGMVIASATRLLVNPGVLARELSFGEMLSDYIINCIKWTIPGILLFDGCRDRKSVTWALFSILVIYVLLAIQVIRWVPIGSISVGGNLSARAYKAVQNEVGYNRVTLSMMLGGASWGILCTIPLLDATRNRMLVSLTAGIVIFGQALTGGRTGYVSWLMIGGVLCAIRWKKLLVYIPIAVALIIAFVPGVKERALQGLIGTDDGQVDQYELSSGRNIAWPYVIDAIQESPLIGYGREAMVTAGIRDELMQKFGESFPHPHNAYFEIFLDNGIGGLVIVVAFFSLISIQALVLLRDRSDPLFAAVGGVCFCLVLALIIGGMGGQTFYPREGSVGMWAAIGLMFRVSADRQRSIQLDSVQFTDSSKS